LKQIALGENIELNDNDDYAITKIKLEYGASTHATYEHGDTPLTDASINGKTEIAKLLLEYGADPNFRIQWTPLMFAATYDNIEIVRLLLEYKARVNVRESMGYTALMLANGRNPEISNLIRKHGGVDTLDFSFTDEEIYTNSE